LRFILARSPQIHHAIQKVIPYQSVLLPEDSGNKYKELSEMAVQDYTAVRNVLVTQKCTSFDPKLNLKFTREFDQFLG
jgi:hypothetical protein